MMKREGHDRRISPAWQIDKAGAVYGAENRGKTERRLQMQVDIDAQLG